MTPQEVPGPSATPDAPTTLRLVPRSIHGVVLPVPLYVAVKLIITSCELAGGGSLNSFVAWTIDQASKLTLFTVKVQFPALPAAPTANGLERDPGGTGAGAGGGGATIGLTHFMTALPIFTL